MPLQCLQGSLRPGNVEHWITLEQATPSAICIKLVRASDAILWQETFTSARETPYYCLPCHQHRKLFNQCGLANLLSSSLTFGHASSRIYTYMTSASGHLCQKLMTLILRDIDAAVSAEMEELSARAGSFKPFRTFVKMLRSALQGSSDTVSLDVLTLTGANSKLYVGAVPHCLILCTCNAATLEVIRTDQVSQ